MSKKDDKETAIKEYIKERHKMNGLEYSVVYSQTELIDYIKSIITSTKGESRASSKKLPSRVIKDVDLSSNLQAISAGQGGGRRYKNIIKKSKKKSQKKTKKKLRKKTKKKTKKKNKKKSGISKSKIQKGGFNIAFLDLNPSKIFMWKPEYAFTNENIQKAFILEARVLWESTVQWRCMSHTWDLSGWQLQHNLKEHVIDDEEFLRRFRATMQIYRTKSRNVYGMYYDGDMNEEIIEGVVDQSDSSIRHRARFYMCNQLIKHALLNSSKHSNNLWYYYLYHHIGVVLEFLENNPRFLNQQLNSCTIGIQYNNVREDELPIEAIQGDGNILNRLIYGCHWIPKTSFAVRRQLILRKNYEFYDIWNTSKAPTPVPSDPSKWKRRNQHALRQFLGDGNTSEEIEEEFRDRNCEAVVDERKEEAKISYDIPYESFICVGVPSNSDHFSIPEHPNTGFKIIMPLLEELMVMLRSNPRLNFTMKELILAVFWYPNFATCKMISILKRNSEFYSPDIKSKRGHDEYKRLLGHPDMSILEFNLFNKVIDEFAISSSQDDTSILKWNKPEILEYNKWLRLEHIEKLYGAGELLERIRRWHDLNIGIIVNELMRGEDGNLDEDYLYGGEKRKLFESKLPKKSEGQEDTITTRRWETDNMEEMISIDWTGAASFTNNLDVVRGFANMQNLNDYGEAYKYFTSDPTTPESSWRAVVEHDFEPVGDTELRVQAGDTVIVTGLDAVVKGWYEGYVEGNPENVGYFPSDYVRISPNPDSPSPTIFNNGDYVDLNTDINKVENNLIHRIIRIKGSYVLNERGELEYREGEFRGAGGILSNLSRHGEEYEYILPEGIILIDRIIEKDFPTKNSLFVELSGRYLHHSLILIYIRDYINKSIQILSVSNDSLSQVDVDALISEEGGRMIMEAYRSFKSVAEHRVGHLTAQVVQNASILDTQAFAHDADPVSGLNLGHVSWDGR